jgi:curved DNA-binding protein CbpA
MANRIIEHPVPLALREIFVDKNTGVLKIRDENFEKMLFFVDGNLSFAKTNVLHERLGEILFKIGKINRSQFWEIHKLMEGKDEKIGKILVNNNYLNQKDLFFGLIFQLRTIAVGIFPLTNGEWEFIDEIPQIPEDSRFTIELPAIFSEGVRKIKNWSPFQNRFQSQTPRLRSISAELAGFLNPEDISFYKDISNYANLPVEQIVGKIHIPEDAFWQKLILFHLLHIIDFMGMIVKDELSKNIEELIHLYDNLKAREIDYYELLNLKNSASSEEIKDAYYKLAKKFHPDRLGSAPDPDLKEKANFVFARINRSYDILSNEDKKRDYDTKGYKEVAPQDKVIENLIEKANILFRKAKTLYNQKKFWEAASILEEAVRYDANKASYFQLLGLAQSDVPALRRSAEKNFQKVMELEPWNAEPYVALGLLFLNEKLEKRAEGFFRKALSIDPDHAMARKKIEEISGGIKKRPMFTIFGKKNK